MSVGKFFSQINQPDPIVRTLDMFPKTPDAAALSKFVDIPPGNYTGVANFTIPIYSINVDGINVPINLAYTTTGVKVGEIASRVGLGWALNAGPSLSQQVIGSRDKTLQKPLLVSADNIPDKCAYESSVASYGFNHPCGIALSAIGLYPYANEVNPDLLPDIFSYSLLNDNGQFIFDYNGEKGIPMPFNMIKIIPKKSYGLLSGMEMIDEKGITYIFKDNIGSKEIVNINSCNPFNEDNDIPNFKLDTIITINNKKIIYQYRKRISSKYITSITEQKIIDTKLIGSPGAQINPYDLPAERCINKTESSDSILSEISFENGKVLFYYNNDPEGFTEVLRQDLRGDVYLTRVVVKDNNNNTIKDISLSYNYFISNDSAPGLYATYLANSPEIYYRLKLTSVKDNLTPNEYKLSYYGDEEGISLPNRMSFSQDYWGAYNGRENDTPIPSVKTSSLKSSKERVYMGANKLPDINYGVIGNLKTIIYPTGGTTKITYEGDDYYKDFNPKMYDYKERHSEETDLHSDYVEFQIEGDNSTIFNQSIILYDSECPENPEHQPIWSTPQWELWKKNSSGTQFTYLDQGPVCTAIEHPVSRNDGPGIYRLKVYRRSVDGLPIPTPANSTRIITARYSWVKEIRVNNSPVDTIGTIRVKQIESNSANNGKIVRKYQYKNLATNLSSGKNQGEELFVPLSFKEKNSSSHINTGFVGNILQYLARNNNPGWQINTVRGKAVAYEYVQEIYQSSTDPSQNYKKESKFYHGENIIPQYEPWKLVNVSWPQKNLDAGLLLDEKLFKSNGDTIRVSRMEYESDPYFNQYASMNPDPSPFSYLIAKGLEISVKKIDSDILGGQYYYFNKEDFNIGNTWIKNIKTTTTDYVNNQPTLVTEQTSAYSTSTQNRHTFPIQQKSEVIGSGVSSSQHYQYALEKGNEYLRGKNMVSIPLVTESKKTVNGVPKTISKTETRYPETIEQARTRIVNNTNNKDIPLPYDVFSSDMKTPSTVTLEVTYDKYDTDGHLLQYTSKSGISTVIIWGYNSTQPIAKVEGATYAQANSIASAIITASNTDASQAPNTDESALLTALDTFRKNGAMANFQITTYTYDPLIGVRSITPPSGIRENYIYDTANRLKEVRDINGRILKENKYNYKQ